MGCTRTWCSAGYVRTVNGKPPVQQNIEPAFVPLRLAPVCDPSPESAEAPAPVVETIRMELSRPGGTLTVHWPVSAAGPCAQMLRDLLR